MINMKLIKVCIVVISLSLTIQAASVKETILISAAAGAICKIYAEEVGGNVEAFSNLNIQVMKIAEKMGYTNNFQSYLSEVSDMKRVLQNQLLKTHSSKLKVYNNWCIGLYDGYQKGLAKAYR